MTFQSELVAVIEEAKQQVEAREEHRARVRAWWRELRPVVAASLEVAAHALQESGGIAVTAGRKNGDTAYLESQDGKDFLQFCINGEGDGLVCQCSEGGLGEIYECGLLTKEKAESKTLEFVSLLTGRWTKG